MAEMIINCPACHQPIQVDDAWAGHQIECPLCKAAVIVPQAAGPAPGSAKSALGKQLVDVPGETKLRAGATQVARGKDNKVPIRTLTEKRAKQKNPIVKFATIVVVIAALGAGGWFGWPYVKPHLKFLNKSDEAAAAAAAAPQEPATPPPPKEPPMTAPTYTLDIAQATTPAGKANGTIAGTNFVPDTVRLDKSASGYVLTLREGAGASPDRGLRVYLKLKPTESPTGQVWTVSKEMKSPVISSVVKISKPNPKYAAKETPFTTGFALKLELGQITDSNTIPGKIYAALPDPEQSVVAGSFNAITWLSSGQPVVTTPQPIATPQSSAQDEEFRKRYGIKR